ncbi:MAG: sulfatase-like hydrolase/transferase, partial [Pseudomonadota bacterium]
MIRPTQSCGLRRTTAITIALLLSALLCARTSLAAQPNILLIIADDQGVDASAQYSVSRDVPRTPTLDRLAANGIVYDNAWATPGCTTTRGTLFTGQHGIHSGIDYIPAPLTDQHETLQQYLRRHPATANYRSAVIGKWHMGGRDASPNHPATVGIDYFAGNLKASVDDYYDWTQTINGNSSKTTAYHTTAITDLAIEWTERQRKPWFLWLAYAAPHAPFHLPPPGLHARKLSGTENSVRQDKRSYYLAAIEAMDAEIGRLLHSLPASSRDNTVVIYIGDNGTPRAVVDAGAFDRTKAKGTLFEGGAPAMTSGTRTPPSNRVPFALVRSNALASTTPRGVPLSPM